MQDPKQLVENYIAAFNETNTDRRREMLDSLYSAGSTYTDPQVDLRGPGEIDGFIEKTQEQFPGYRFALRGPIDAHHDQMRFQWQAGPPEDPEQFIGFDVIVAGDGRIRSVHGFLDAVPAA